MPVTSLILALLIATVAWMQPAAARPLAAVKASGELKVAVYADFPPYSFEQDGRLVGIDVDAARALAESLGVRATFMVREGGENLDDDLRVNVWRGDIVERKVADVMMHVPLDRALAARNDDAFLCCAYFREELAVLHDTAVVPEVGSLAGFGATKIAVENDTISDFFLTSAFHGQLRNSVVRGRRFADAEEAFATGAAPALMAPRAQLEWVARRTPRHAALALPAMPGLAKRSWTVGIAVRVDSRDLADALGAALGDLRVSGRLDAICSRYGVTALPVAGEQ